MESFFTCFTTNAHATICLIKRDTLYKNKEGSYHDVYEVCCICLFSNNDPNDNK